MSDIIIPTPLRNAAWTIADAASVLMGAVYRESLKLPVEFKLLNGAVVEVREAYDKKEGWIVIVRIPEAGV